MKIKQFAPWMLDKLEDDIKQNIYNLKKAGLDESILIEKLKEIHKHTKAFKKLL